MRDPTGDPQASRNDLVAQPACCSGGACGPVFETPLLELAFNRIRDFARNRDAATLAEATPANPPLDQVLSAVPAGTGPPPRPRKDAPHD